MAVAHNLAHNTLPEGAQRKVSVYLPPPSPKPDGEKVPDFVNYSSGEDDSRWLSRVQREEEEKLKRNMVRSPDPLKSSTLHH